MGLVNGDEQALVQIDETTVKTLELRAPWASTADVNFVHPKVLGGEIFSTFSEQQWKQIWAQLERVDCLIPSLYTFFRDFDYLEACVRCVRRLVHITCNVKATVTSALGNKLQYVPERDCRVVVQVAEDRFITVPGSHEERIDLHVRQLYAFAMCHFPAMPPDPQKENLVEGPRAQADPAVLRRLDNLAARLGFGSDEVSPVSGLALPDRHNERPLLVTTGPGPRLKQRCGKPLSEAHKQDKDLLFIHHLHDERRERGEGITTFYIRQSIYLAFFGRPGTNGAGGATSSSAPPIPQNVHSLSPPRDRNDGQMNPPPLGRVFSGPVAEPTGRAETHRSPTNPEPMEQDVEAILAIYTQREDSDQYHTNAQVEDDEDMMQVDESQGPEPSEAVWEEQEQGLQEEGMQQSNVDYCP